MFRASALSIALSAPTASPSRRWMAASTVGPVPSARSASIASSRSGCTRRSRNTRRTSYDWAIHAVA
jgi:hypothetical protein